MNKRKIAFTFLISFIIAFFIVGYVRNTMFVAIDWVVGATIWSKFKEYYIRTFALNLPPALILALISTILIALWRTFGNKSVQQASAFSVIGKMDDATEQYLQNKNIDFKGDKPHE